MKIATTAGVRTNHRPGGRGPIRSAAIATALVLVTGPAISRARGHEDLVPQPCRQPGGTCSPTAPIAPDADGDGIPDATDDCPRVSNPAQTDTDGDRVGDACDNCVTVYNPGQENTDEDSQGGDACDMTVTFPLSGDVTCDDAAPSIAWSPALFDRFTVFVGTDPAVLYPVTSGTTPLRRNVWTVPASKWATLCRHASAYLYIRVMGKVAWNESATLSNVAVLKVR